MANVRELIGLLELTIADRSRRGEHIERFQEHVWARKDLDANPEVVRVLRDLAYDLEFFEPDDGARAEDPSLYGDARLEEEIGFALKKLRS